MTVAFFAIVTLYFTKLWISDLSQDKPLKVLLYYIVNIFKIIIFVKFVKKKGCAWGVKLKFKIMECISLLNYLLSKLVRSGIEVVGNIVIGSKNFTNLTSGNLIEI